MKKKVRHRREASPAQHSANYVVGEVSDSLFQTDSAGSGSLSALFSRAGPAAAVVFQPAPKPVQKSTETTEVKVQPSQKQKKPPKVKSAADQELENRESSLQNADEDERGPGTSVRKRKEPGRDGDVEYWVKKRQRLKGSREEEAAKRRRTAFVGNLPASCTKKTLRSLFRDAGPIESIRFRSVVREDPSMSRKVAAIKRKVHPKKQSVNAYVVFRDEEGVARALQSNGAEIQEDFHIRVDRAGDSSTHDHKRSAFVGNLSFEINEATLRRHFDDCGTVEAVRLVRDHNSGLGKGFGYVLFQSADSVQLALKLDGSKLQGRSIRVSRSVKKEKQRSRTAGRATGCPGRSPARGPGRAAGTEGGGRWDGVDTAKQFGAKPPRSNSFKGEMVDPSKKTKAGQKKKPKPKRPVHL